MPNPGLWSTSRHFDRGQDFATAYARYLTARTVALNAPSPSVDQLDAWGAATDAVIAAPTGSAADLAAKVRLMLTEGRGGDGCLIAVLEDLDTIAGGGSARGKTDEIRARAGQAVGHA